MQNNTKDYYKYDDCYGCLVVEYCRKTNRLTISTRRDTDIAFKDVPYYLVEELNTLLQRISRS